MELRSRLRAGGLATVLVAGLGLSGASAAAAPGTGADRTGAGQGTGTQAAPTVSVTLVTGDRVTMSGDRVLDVQPGPGRDAVATEGYVDGGDRYVVPVDVSALVASGRLERELFNVSALIRAGYDDAHRRDLPLIVTEDPGASPVRTRARAAGVTVVRDLPSVDGVAVRADKARVGTFLASLRGGAARLAAGVSHVYLDSPIQLSLDQSAPQVGAPTAWAAGHTGQGVTVAVLDSGVDTTHPDVADAVTLQADFSTGQTGPRDRNGHGTHVTSIITGSGAASGGQYKGIAPDAKIISGKVVNDDGRGGTESTLMAGMEWAVTNHADLVNMSLSSSIPGEGTSAVEQSLNRLTRETGTLFVVAAGNNGRTGIGIPGAADEALTVGAVDKQDQLYSGSSRGPRLGDGAIKPNITAPGVDIVAARAEGSVVGPPVGEDYMRLTGTSMATPHVSGAAAILAAQHPDWTARELRPALSATGNPHPDLTVYEQGAGRLDVARADTQRVFSDTVSLSLGTALYPHGDDPPISRTITYRNTGTAPVTLDVAVDVRDETGAPAPAGMFTVTPAQLTLAPGATGTATVVTDTRVEAPNLVYGGVVTASGQGVSLRTPIGVTREAERYNVSFTILDRAGQPVPGGNVDLRDIDKPFQRATSFPDGHGTLRMPPGRYFLESTTWDEDGTSETADVFVEPTLVVSGDMSLTLDARDTVPIAPQLDHTEAGVARVAVTGTRVASPDQGGFLEHTYRLAGVDSVAYRPSRTSAPGEFTFTVEADMAKPDGQGGFTNSPYNYHLEWTEVDRIPASLSPRFRDLELARVENRIAAQVPGQVITKGGIFQVTTPTTVVDWYTGGGPFYTQIRLDADGGDSRWFSESLEDFEPGETYTRQWNMGPFGPAFPGRTSPNGSGLWTERFGDFLAFDVPLTTDQVASHHGRTSDVTGIERALFRDGVPVEPIDGEGREYLVPPEEATYRYETRLTRDLSPLSTDVRAAWTFRSASTEDSTPLPMMAVRFAPGLDQLNRAPAGTGYAFPVSVQRQAGADLGPLNSLAVEASFDDGRTWQNVTLEPNGEDFVAVLTHPAGPGFVSLRATAEDTNGNKVEQTVIRAYQLNAA